MKDNMLQVNSSLRIFNQGMIGIEYFHIDPIDH